MDNYENIISHINEFQNQFLSINVYYNIARYYLNTGEKRCDPELGYEYYMRFRNTYRGEFHKYDLEHDNLHFILREFLMI